MVSNAEGDEGLSEVDEEPTANTIQLDEFTYEDARSILGKKFVEQHLRGRHSPDGQGHQPTASSVPNDDTEIDDELAQSLHGQHQSSGQDEDTDAEAEDSTELPSSPTIQSQEKPKRKTTAKNKQAKQRQEESDSDASEPQVLFQRPHKKDPRGAIAEDEELREMASVVKSKIRISKVEERIKDTKPPCPYKDSDIEEYERILNHIPNKKGSTELSTLALRTNIGPEHITNDGCAKENSILRFMNRKNLWNLSDAAWKRLFRNTGGNQVKAITSHSITQNAKGGRRQRAQPLMSQPRDALTGKVLPHGAQDKTVIPARVTALGSSLFTSKNYGKELRASDLSTHTSMGALERI